MDDHVCSHLDGETGVVDMGVKYRDWKFGKTRQHQRICDDASSPWDGQGKGERK